MFNGSIPALITPFNENLEVDYSTLEVLLKLHVENGSDAIVLAGTTGESPTLDSEELLELIIFSKKILGSRLPLIVGTGSNCTKKTITMTKKAKALGADGALVIVPYYNKPTDEGCLEHFRQVANIGLPIIAYHHPGRTGKTLRIATLIKLLKLPNIVALKEASGSVETTQKILKAVPEANVFSGDDPLTLELIKLGACGSISIIANLWPNEWAKIVHRALKNEFQEASKQYNKISSTIEKVLAEPNPIGIKQAMQEQNMCKNYVRLPLIASKTNILIKS